MPQAVIPFKLDSKSFIISILVIMGVIKLAFVILCAMPSRTWWLKRVRVGLKILHLDDLSQRLSIYDSRNTAVINGYGQTDSTHVVDMDRFSV